MIGLDTNILVRYFAQDDPLQSQLAREVIDSRLTVQQPGFVSLVTLAELAWVLNRRYQLPPTALAAVIERLLGACNPQQQFTLLWRW